VRALRLDGERDVETAVHEDTGRATRTAPSGFGELACPVEPVGTLELTLAQLEPVGSICEGGLDGGGQRLAAGRAVDDQAQDGTLRAQKVASPSSGLDADAYSRRGMRPAS